MLLMLPTGIGKETMNGLIFHELGQSRVSDLKERPQQGEREASEEQGKTLTVACKLVQKKSCTSSGLHLPVPPNCGTPR